MRDRRAALIGTPNMVADQICSLMERLGTSTILLQIDFGAMTGADARSSLELYIEKIMPACL